MKLPFSATTVRDFKSNSFMDWQLIDSFKNSLKTRELDIQLRYRSRDSDGVLFHVEGDTNAEFMKLEVWAHCCDNKKVGGGRLLSQ